MSTRWPGAARRMLRIGMRLWPPARTLPSCPTSARTATASATLRGAWWTKGEGFTVTILPCVVGCGYGTGSPLRASDVGNFCLNPAPEWHVGHADPEDRRGPRGVVLGG